MARGIWRLLRDDEQGGGTVYGLLWFALLVGICGLAVDTTDGFRNKTMLQATADSAALAAVIDLPDGDAAVANAVAYAAENLEAEEYGDVLQPGDVEVGLWDEDAREFSLPGPAPLLPLNAVRVTLNQTVANDNAVPSNFLRMIGLQSWDVRALAVGQAFTPMCLKNGLVARGVVDITSNNGFTNEICIHGEQGVHMQNNNYFETGVKVTMRDMGDLTIPTGGMASNPGLPAALGEENKDPRLVNRVDDIMADFLDRTSGIHQAYTDTTLAVLEIDEFFDMATALPGRIYHALCAPQKQIQIPANSVLANVVLIADCQIQIGSGATVINSVLGSRSDGGPTGKDKAIIKVPAGAQIGLPDNCAPGGGVQLFSNATMHFSSSTKFDGVQMVAAGDIELGARDQGINGISAEAGGDITMTANNQFGLCQGGVPELRRFFYYRLVQ